MLVGIAICISDSVRRAGDCAARYGGEEFAVLLPGLSTAEALAVAETIRLKVEQWSDEPDDHDRQHRRREHDAGRDRWTGPIWSTAADKALYAAKANGRNQSVLATSRLSLVADVIPRHAKRESLG